MGRRLNLSPLVVILSLSFWGMTWGVLGMFLAVPITSIILIILSHFPSTHNVALLFSEKGDIDRPEEVGDIKISLETKLEPNPDGGLANS